MTKKIIITLPDELLADIDNAAAAERRSRSEIIREAARQYINKGTESVFESRAVYYSNADRVRKIMERISKASAEEWDSAQAVRELRDKDNEDIP